MDVTETPKFIPNETTYLTPEELLAKPTPCLSKNQRIHAGKMRFHGISAAVHYVCLHDSILLSVFIGMVD